jgi:Tol biopolymer transport system component
VSQGSLFTRRLDQSNSTELAGTVGASAPFFSPDGQWVAFFSPGKLQKVSVEGGSAITLCDSTSAGGGSWGEDGNIIAALNLTVGLSRIPSAGGPPTPVTDFQNGEITHRWPQILPGGKTVLFTANTGGGFDGANIEVMSFADHGRKTLVRGGTYGHYLPSGHLRPGLVQLSKLLGVIASLRAQLELGTKADLSDHSSIDRHPVSQ